MNQLSPNSSTEKPSLNKIWKWLRRVLETYMAERQGDGKVTEMPNTADGNSAIR
jgi:hypothetical protein